MRGRLGFAQSLMFGKFGRAQLQPFSNRQYSRARRGSHPLNLEIREVIPWRIAVLRTVSERRTMVQGPLPVVIYVGAAGCGHLGAVVFMDGQERVFSTHSPEWMAEDNDDIYDYEMAESLVGVSLASELCPGRTVILCGDNMGASQTLVRGSCKTSTGGTMCAFVWTIAATLSVPLWIESVAGTLNPSDPPSRDCPMCNKPSRVEVERCEVPNISHIALNSLVSLKNSQFPVAAGTACFCNAWPCPQHTAESQ